MTEHVDTVIIGAGQAGLSLSYYLTRQQRSHVILEKQRIGEAWRSAKWDSFTLVTPNWTLRLPGFLYQGENANGFSTRDEVVRYLEAYAAYFNPPVRPGVEVTGVQGAGDGFVVRTGNGTITAFNVVVATSIFQKPHIPAFSAEIPPSITQRHSSHYRNPESLPDGAVLIVGSGQSGCQIAEELIRTGRKVYLCTGKAGQLPRRYRGKDVFEWAELIGFMDHPVSILPTPQVRFASNPQLTGIHGGHTISLHQLAREGVTLLGRLEGVQGTTLQIGDTLRESVMQADKFATDFAAGIDKFIAESGMDAPLEPAANLRTAYEVAPIPELNLEAENIQTVIWATGYAFNFDWIQFPIFDTYGYPVQERGVTAQPGLYFLGLHWLHVRKSALFSGVGEDAEYIAGHIAERDELPQIPHPPHHEF